MSRPAGLGRGLGALIPQAAPGRSGLVTLPLEVIEPNPRQPRGDFDPAGLADLAASLREFGLLQPVVVRPAGDGRYQLVAGERRLRAAKLAGLGEIPAVVRHTADAALLTEALVENVHRADLNPLEEAAAYQQLIEDFAITHEQLAAKLGKSRSAVTNTLRLLNLPPEVQQHLATGQLSPGHARALLAVDDRQEQARLAGRIAAEGLSVRAVELLVARRRSAPAFDDRPGADPPPAPARPLPGRGRTDAYRHLAGVLSDALATRVRVQGSASRGRIVIDYAGGDDLQRLLRLLAAGLGEVVTRER